MKTILFRNVQITRNYDANKIEVWSDFVDLALSGKPLCWKPTKDKEAQPLFTLNIEESLCLFSFAVDHGKREICKITVELFDNIERTNFNPWKQPIKVEREKSWIQKIYVAWRGLF